MLESRPLETQADDSADEEVLVLLRQITRAIDLRSRQVARQSGLTTPQVVVMRAIRSLGNVTTRQLSGQVSLSQATVTTILEKLVVKGLVERRRSENDRRVVHSSLTLAGQEALLRAPPLLHDEFRLRFNELTGKKQEQMIESLRLIASLLGASDIDASPLLVLEQPVEDQPRK